MAILLSCVAIAQDGGVESGETAQSCTVYVLLRREDKRTQEGEERPLALSVRADGGFVVQDCAHRLPAARIDASEVQIAATADGKITVNGRMLALPQVCIKPAQPGGTFAFDGNVYTGILYLLRDDARWYVVNGVDLEEYVYGVLRLESWPGWPLEINKAQAIILRSYVIAKIVRMRGKKKIGKGFLYDVHSTNADQTYKGTHSYTRLREAVDATRGVVLAYNRNPINAMYDVCCGGIIPAHVEHHDFGAEPYLARSYPCTFCASCKAYSWKASYTCAELEKLLHEAQYPIKPITKVGVARYDKAGVVQDVVIKGRSSEVRLSRKKIYSLCKDLKSFSFSIARKAGKVIFVGKGYGHHMGLCQWGARKMVELGYLYPEILRFYYPGTNLMRLEVVSSS